MAGNADVAEDELDESDPLESLEPDDDDEDDEEDELDLTGNGDTAMKATWRRSEMNTVLGQSPPRS